MSLDAQVPIRSSIPKDQFELIRLLPGIRRNAAGAPIAVAESLLSIPAPTKTDRWRLSVPIYGVTSGRMFRPGLRELIASNTCARQFADFAVGDKRQMHGAEWLVVGNFDLGRIEGDCTAYADADTILSSFGRVTYSAVNAMLQSVASFGDLTAALNANPSLRVRARYEAQSESMFLAAPGALIGALLAWLFFNGLQASPFGTTIHLAVTPALALLGIGWSLGRGLLSGFLTALRAARVPVAVAMRATRSPSGFRFRGERSNPT